jgi:hypothetical protein
MHISTEYTSIGSERNGETGDTYFFMMNNLLYSRMESGYPSNDEYYDEDVNVYIAGLLASLVDPAHHASMSNYIVRYDISLFELIESTENNFTKYRIYKTNADFLLVSLGIFNNPKQMKPHADPFMRMTRNAYIGRGMAYYRLAQSYCRETSRRHGAVDSVLGKLSTGFEKYARVLSLMRSEYLNLFRRITNGELYHLGASVKHLGDRNELDALYDEFLDAYSRHRREPTPETRRAVGGLAERIRKLDPAFRFEID